MAFIGSSSSRRLTCPGCPGSRGHDCGEGGLLRGGRQGCCCLCLWVRRLVLAPRAGHPAVGRHPGAWGRDLLLDALSDLQLIHCQDHVVQEDAERLHSSFSLVAGQAGGREEGGEGVEDFRTVMNIDLTLNLRTVLLLELPATAGGGGWWFIFQDRHQHQLHLLILQPD